jgi:hypothetical protein
MAGLPEQIAEVDLQELEAAEDERVADPVLCSERTVVRIRASNSAAGQE